MTPELRLPVASRPDIVASNLVWISKETQKSRRDLKSIMRMTGDEERRIASLLAEELGLVNLLDEEPDEIDA